MKKLISKCELEDLKKNAAKIIKIQVKYHPKNWRRASMSKYVSEPFKYCKIKQNDDYLSYETNED
eukprot:CAMPEP_0176340232 /NCGR_PEP_ID=MMETSP0126-20121128/1408_1 /TAXON_ID=141414 ORGANISM="Strombidinopsis acuminatum, Strain SPMC142" /NCGR_SAMPLE_ID=MMETSP0126 /ASSEMBLY_ACC=CAM_ASM_000229 /LENGTH=64 /DNA_ID=CAMNT_0017684315 /DNA_START=1716 /DNA_END=1910 /DNA_ORIENTATION=-